MKLSPRNYIFHSVLNNCIGPWKVLSISGIITRECNRTIKSGRGVALDISGIQNAPLEFQRIALASLWTGGQNATVYDNSVDGGAFALLFSCEKLAFRLSYCIQKSIPNFLICNQVSFSATDDEAQCSSEN